MCAKPGNVLIIADGEKPAERLGRWVASAGEQPVLVHGADTQIFERGDDETIDLVVIDLDTEAADARRILEHLDQGELFSGVPQLHVLRDPTERARIAERRPDAATVTMPESNDLADFQSQVRLAAEVGKLRRANSRLMMRDDLTGAHNRQYVRMRLEQEFARARRHHGWLTLVLLEIDEFDALRTRHGSAVAEGAILHLSEVLRATVRREDIHGRWGPGSFSVILPGTSYRGAATFANHVRCHAQATGLIVNEQSIQVRLSAGIAAHSGDRQMESLDGLVQAAETALEQAQSRGGNRVFIDEALIITERGLILIADPDTTLLEPAEDLLTLDGYLVGRAEDASALLLSVRERRPDLLILDLQLGGSESGSRTLVDQVQALCPGNPIPIVGLARPTAVPPSRTAGRPRVDRYLTKPFSVSVLRSVAQDLLGRCRGGNDVLQGAERV